MFRNLFPLSALTSVSLTLSGNNLSGLIKEGSGNKIESHIPGESHLRGTNIAATEQLSSQVPRGSYSEPALGSPGSEPNCKNPEPTVAFVRDPDIILTSKISDADFNKYSSKTIDEGINSADAVQIESQPESVNEIFPEEHEQSSETLNQTVSQLMRIRIQRGASLKI
jgi:hypothetical protein